MDPSDDDDECAPQVEPAVASVLLLERAPPPPGGAAGGGYEPAATVLAAAPAGEVSAGLLLAPFVFDDGAAGSGCGSGNSVRNFVITGEDGQCVYVSALIVATRAVCVSSSEPQYRLLGAAAAWLAESSSVPQFWRRAAFLTRELPLPAPGYSLSAPHLGAAASVAVVRTPAYTEHPAAVADADMTLLLTLLPVPAVVDLLRALLTEQRVVLLAPPERAHLLAPACHAAVSLLFPLKWSAAYVPFLPPGAQGLGDMADSPCPYILGLPAARRGEIPEDVMRRLAVVDLGAGTVTLPRGKQPAALAGALSRLFSPSLTTAAAAMAAASGADGGVPPLPAHIHKALMAGLTRLTVDLKPGTADAVAAAAAAAVPPAPAAKPALMTDGMAAAFRAAAAAAAATAVDANEEDDDVDMGTTADAASGLRWAPAEYRLASVAPTAAAALPTLSSASSSSAAAPALVSARGVQQVVLDTLMLRLLGDYDAFFVEEESASGHGDASGAAADAPLTAQDAAGYLGLRYDREAALRAHPELAPFLGRVLGTQAFEAFLSQRLDVGAWTDAEVLWFDALCDAAAAAAAVTAVGAGGDADGGGNSSALQLAAAASPYLTDPALMPPAKVNQLVATCPEGRGSGAASCSGSGSLSWTPAAVERLCAAAGIVGGDGISFPAAYRKAAAAAAAAALRLPHADASRMREARLRRQRISNMYEARAAAAVGRGRRSLSAGTAEELGLATDRSDATGGSGRHLVGAASRRYLCHALSPQASRSGRRLIGSPDGVAPAQRRGRPSMAPGAAVLAAGDGLAVASPAKKAQASWLAKVFGRRHADGGGTPDGSSAGVVGGRSPLQSAAHLPLPSSPEDRRASMSSIASFMSPSDGSGALSRASAAAGGIAGGSRLSGSKRRLDDGGASAAAAAAPLPSLVRDPGSVIKASLTSPVFQQAPPGAKSVKRHRRQQLQEKAVSSGFGSPALQRGGGPRTRPPATPAPAVASSGGASSAAFAAEPAAAGPAALAAAATPLPADTAAGTPAGVTPSRADVPSFSFGDFTHGASEDAPAAPAEQQTAEAVMAEGGSSSDGVTAMAEDGAEGDAAAPAESLASAAGEADDGAFAVNDAAAVAAPPPADVAGHDGAAASAPAEAADVDMATSDGASEPAVPSAACATADAETGAGAVPPPPSSPLEPAPEPAAPPAPLAVDDEMHRLRDALRAAGRENRRLREELQCTKGAVRVMVRVRPMVDTRRLPAAVASGGGDDGSAAAAVASGPQVSVCAVGDTSLRAVKPGNGGVTGANAGSVVSYDYDRVFAPDASQGDVYGEVEASVAAVVASGRNGCVLAYGQTGSGKTFTMNCGPHDAPLPPALLAAGGADGAGAPPLTEADLPRETGVYARALVTIFSELADAGAIVTTTAAAPAAPAGGGSGSLSAFAGSHTAEVRLGVFEIYNDEIRDLLQAARAVAHAAGCGCGGCDADGRPRDKVTVRQGGTPAHPVMLYDGLTQPRVPSARAALRLLAAGSAARAVASNGINARSSRSHTVVVITVRRTQQATLTLAGAAGDVTNSVVTEGKLVLVDLAGCERLGRLELEAAAAAAASAASASSGGPQRLLTSLSTWFQGGPAAAGDAPLPAAPAAAPMPSGLPSQPPPLADLESRKEESRHINSSLTVLGQVVLALSGEGGASTAASASGAAGGALDSLVSAVTKRAGAPGAGAGGPAAHVPYRDSTLTWALRDCLGGTARTTMLCCVSPAAGDISETLNTLEFGGRARRIKARVVSNVAAATEQAKPTRAAAGASSSSSAPSAAAAARATAALEARVAALEGELRAAREAAAAAAERAAAAEARLAAVAGVGGFVSPSRVSSGAAGAQPPRSALRRSARKSDGESGSDDIGGAAAAPAMPSSSAAAAALAAAASPLPPTGRRGAAGALAAHRSPLMAGVAAGVGGGLAGVGSPSAVRLTQQERLNRLAAPRGTPASASRRHLDTGAAAAPSPAPHPTADGGGGASAFASSSVDENAAPSSALKLSILPPAIAATQLDGAAGGPASPTPGARARRGGELK